MHERIKKPKKNVQQMNDGEEEAQRGYPQEREREGKGRRGGKRSQNQPDGYNGNGAGLTD